MAEPACKITRYDCSDAGQAAEVKRLTDVANVQQEKDHGFVSIFPWLGGCDLAPRHYVAQRADDTICGWATVIPKEFKTTKYLYLSEISVIRIPDETFKGVGLRLHDAIVEDATKEGKEFIYLYPLTPAVEETYVKKWGYKKFPAGEFLFYKIKSDPTPAILDSLKPIEDMPRRLTTEAYARVSWDEKARETLLKNRRRVLVNQDSLEELAEVLNDIELRESLQEDPEADPESMLTPEEAKDMILGVFERAPPIPGGRRKTRRQPKRRRTQRKRKQERRRKV